MIDVEELSKKYSFVIGFKIKRYMEKVTNQDKIHIRILAILELEKRVEIDEILKRKFREVFIFDKEAQITYYCIKFIKERKVKSYADC